MVHVTAPRHDENPALAELLAASFATDPVIARILPPENRTRDSLHLWYLAQVDTAAAVDVARDEDGTAVGVALWEPPHASWNLRDRFRPLPRMVRAAGGVVRYHRSCKVMSKLEEHRPRTPHWYLADLAVASSARGTGVGSRLLQHRLPGFDRDGHDAYLEATTAGSRRLYERNGFEAVATSYGSCTSMVRRPRNAPALLPSEPESSVA
ncbi:GNAT family N-acetyltransferase [Kineococcus sp. SYSU DK003]|uniref:GNAT family N-acetyltransferase n=1 Tax=Kineococcus sp. SYSU DK003 TaxID=3383124 RepID=UPI003D7D2342